MVRMEGPGFGFCGNGKKLTVGYIEMLDRDRREGCGMKIGGNNMILYLQQSTFFFH